MKFEEHLKKWVDEMEKKGFRVEQRIDLQPEVKETITQREATLVDYIVKKYLTSFIVGVEVDKKKK